MFPLGNDIVEECQAVAALTEADYDAWQPLFEPKDFNEAHAPLKLSAYQLSTDELREWAERVVKIRMAINE